MAVSGSIIYCIFALVHTTTLAVTHFTPFKSVLSSLPIMKQSASITGPNLPGLMHPTSPQFINKAFTNSMKPSRIIPFYYKSSGTFQEEDITITTLVTGNRFQVFSRLVSTYQGTIGLHFCRSYQHLLRPYTGPISATVHISSTPVAHRDALLDALHELYVSNPHMTTYVDIHLVLDPFERQFNLWRNVARFYARTNYVMMLDVDFALCTDFRSRILQSDAVLQRLREGLMALVVPAFEFARQKDGLNASTFPTNKQVLTISYYSLHHVIRWG